MRNPNRIDKFCDALKEMWHRVPDWRFGQLMSNFLGYVYEQSGKDIWFFEEPEMLKYVEEYQKSDIEKKTGH